MPCIHIITAMTKDLVIGDKGRLPWSIPEDLKLFRQQTINKTVLMGRTTYLSIGQPLSQRNNIVISRTLSEIDGVSVCNNFAEGITLAKRFGKDIFCIGGEEIYRQALPIANYLHISWVENNISGDCFFPQFDLEEWCETSRLAYSGFFHCTYARRNNNAP